MNFRILHPIGFWSIVQIIYFIFNRIQYLFMVYILIKRFQFHSFMKRTCIYYKDFFFSKTDVHIVKFLFLYWYLTMVYVDILDCIHTCFCFLSCRYIPFAFYHCVILRKNGKKDLRWWWLSKVDNLFICFLFYPPLNQQLCLLMKTFSFFFFLCMC